ncbi:MAG: D-2-hydroxyacid dehydrogenase [Clostridia bacterium]|nr:D-2-hydroxyacid dehydrogenase [Clostridia bacterium]MBQ6863693.1 D-2-hydroxyacid dehydrogenase [Clostridia bacterium]
MKAVILDGFCENPGDLSWDAAKELCDFTIYDRTAPEDVLSRAAGAEIVVVNKVALTREIIEQLPDLRFVAILATGYNIIDTECCAERGIPVANIPAYSTDSVAQYVFSFILAHASRVAEHSAAVHDGAWTACPDFTFRVAPICEIAGKTLGIVGYGKIGQKVAAIGRAFGMNILANTAHPEKYAGEDVSFVDLDTLAGESDFISLHCPLTKDTNCLVNAEFLGKMKENAFLANTSRGPVVDEQALADALNNGSIAGAGVDVLSTEPPKAENPLLSAKNCFITPHIAWAPLETRQRLMDIFVENIRAFINGSPINVVNM